MNLKTIKALDNEQLLATILNTETELTKQENSVKGVSKKTATERQRLLSEFCNRNGLNLKKVLELSN